MQIRRLGAMSIYLGMMVGVPACTAPVERTDDEATSTDRSELAADPHAFVCNGFEPGLPIPLSKESTYESCLVTCNNGPDHPTNGQCVGTCCTQVVRCAQCFEQ